MVNKGIFNGLIQTESFQECNDSPFINMETLDIDMMSVTRESLMEVEDNGIGEIGIFVPDIR